MSNNGHLTPSAQPLSIRPSPNLSTGSQKLPTDFDRQFTRHVLPALHRGARNLAPFVARGDISFEEASNTLAALAVRRGATGLRNFDACLACLDIYLADRVAEAQP